MRLPDIDAVGYFSFKDPFDKHIRNMLRVDSPTIQLTVISIKSMYDHVVSDKRDPYSDIYLPVGIIEVEYKQDLKDKVPLITFMYLDEYKSERLFRVPATYISYQSNPSVVEYSARDLVFSLPSLPVDLDVSFIKQDLSDLIQTYLGVTPLYHEVTSAMIENLSIEESETRETIRKNTVKVKKTLSVRLEQITNERDAILARLDELGIVLGDQP